jgi:uncharacterized membrane protein
LVVEKTSSLTYNIAGNFKVILAIILSVLIFKNEVKLINFVACLLPIIGAFLYNYQKVEQKKEKDISKVV